MQRKYTSVLKVDNQRKIEVVIIHVELSLIWRITVRHQNLSWYTGRYTIPGKLVEPEGVQS